jgi:hypothetical protein
VENFYRESKLPHSLSWKEAFHKGLVLNKNQKISTARMAPVIPSLEKN